jgi:hypothetical protein
MAYCPFCGVFAETPHTTQERCIDALKVEIERMRELLGQVQSSGDPGMPATMKLLPEDDQGPDRGV